MFLSDKELRIVSYELLLSVLTYQTCVIRKEFENANKILPKIPVSHHDRIAKFLEKQGFKDIALQVARDPEIKFDLAVELKRLDDAHSILEKNLSKSGSGITQTEILHKWKKLGDLALSMSRLDLAIKCATSGHDLSGLLLMSTCTGDVERLKIVARDAKQAGRTNVAFLSLFLLGDVEACLDLLCSVGRIPEAAFLARTYMPSHVTRIVQMWRKDLASVSQQAAESLADPTEYEEMFPDFQSALKAEEAFKKARANVLGASSAFSSGDGDDDGSKVAEEKVVDTKQKVVVAPPPPPVLKEEEEEDSKVKKDDSVVAADDDDDEFLAELEGEVGGDTTTGGDGDDLDDDIDLDDFNVDDF